jgi:hypothetical protein
MSARRDNPRPSSAGRGLDASLAQLTQNVDRIVATLEALAQRIEAAVSAHAAPPPGAQTKAEAASPTAEGGPQAAAGLVAARLAASAASAAAATDGGKAATEGRANDTAPASPATADPAPAGLAAFGLPPSGQATSATGETAAGDDAQRPAATAAGLPGGPPWPDSPPDEAAAPALAGQLTAGAPQATAPALETEGLPWPPSVPALPPWTASALPSAGLGQLQGLSGESATSSNQVEQLKVARDQLAEHKKTNQFLEKKTADPTTVFGP